MNGPSPLGWLILIVLGIIAFFVVILPMTACVAFVLGAVFGLTETVFNISLLIAAVLVAGAIIRGIMS